MPVFGGWIVGEEEKLERLGRAGVENFVCLAGRMEEEVAAGEGVAGGVGTDGRAAGGDPEEFPLGGVGVEGPYALAGARRVSSKGWPPRPVGVWRFAPRAMESSLLEPPKVFFGEDHVSHGTSSRWSLRCAMCRICWPAAIAPSWSLR